MYSNIDPRKHAIFTGEMYGTKVTVDLDHSDISMDEMFEAFKTLATGLGWSEETWRRGIKDLADQYSEEEDWDNTLNDGLEDEPPYISDDFQIGPDGAHEFIQKLTPGQKKSIRKAIKEKNKKD